MNTPKPAVWLLLCILTGISQTVRADDPLRNLRREVAELKKLSLQLHQQLEQLEVKLTRADLKSKPLRPAFDTPQRTFATFQQASCQHEWKTVVQCYTAEARDNMAKAMFVIAPFMALSVEESRQEKFADDLEQVFVKHLPFLYDDNNENALENVGHVLELAVLKSFVDSATQTEVVGHPEENPAEVIEKELANRRQEAQEELTRLVSQIKDRNLFLADILRLLHEYTDPDDDDDVLMDRLVNVKISGDTASGSLIRLGQNKPRPITFKRIGGAWKIDQHK